MPDQRRSEPSITTFAASATPNGTSARHPDRRRKPDDSRHHRAQRPAQVDGVPWMISADESQMYYMAAEYEALTGLSCADLHVDPDSWRDALHPDDRDRVVAAMEARGPGVHVDERDTVYRLAHPGASAREVRVCSWPVRDDDGCVLFRAGVVVDITDCAEGAAVPPRMYAGADRERRGLAD